MLQNSFAENLHLARMSRQWLLFFCDWVNGSFKWEFSLKQNLQVPDVISDSSVLIVNNFLPVHDIQIDFIVNIKRAY